MIVMVIPKLFTNMFFLNHSYFSVHALGSKINNKNMPVYMPVCI